MSVVHVESVKASLDFSCCFCFQFDVSEGSLCGQVQVEFLDCDCVTARLFKCQSGCARKISSVSVANGGSSKSCSFACQFCFVGE